MLLIGCGDTVLNFHTCDPAYLKNTVLVLFESLLLFLFNIIQQVFA